MDVVIQVSKGASDKKFIHLNALVQALSNDVDLNPIPTENRLKFYNLFLSLMDVIAHHSLLALAK